MNQISKLNEILLPIKIPLKEVEQYMQESFKKDHQFIAKVGQYVLASGGKRIRPAIMLLSSLYFGKYNNDVKKLAGILEYIHTASLMHDDIVDSALERRNNKTANNIWGNKRAVLVGDYFFAKSFEKLTELNNIYLVKLFSQAISFLSEGEILQLLHNFESASAKQYFRIIKCKTAFLLSVAMQTGAILANKDSAVIKKMALCGENLGLAFQIIDDILDYQGEASGKQIGIDLKEKKITLPLCRLIELSSKTEREEIVKILKSKSITTTQIKRVTSLMQKHLVFQYCFTRAKNYSKKAKNILQQFPPNQYLEKLIELADFIVARHY